MISFFRHLFRIPGDWPWRNKHRMEQINEKLPIKRVELSLSKFNEVAIPHHLDLLKRHRANITKFIASGDLKRLKNEEINARRIVLQLKNLIYEMDILRQRVLDADIEKFDKMTKKSRLKSVAAIKEYLDLFQSNFNVMEEKENIDHSILNDRILEQSIPDLRVEHLDSLQNEQSPMTNSVIPLGDSLQIQLIVEDDEIKLAEKKACLSVWENLHGEMLELHGLFVNFQDALNSQRRTVDVTEDNTVHSAVNVLEARRNLAAAEKVSAAMYPIAFAIIGGCVGGPIGLALGAKLGGIAMLGGSVMGFTGGRLLKRRAKAEEDTARLQIEGALENLTPIPQVDNRAGDTTELKMLPPD